MAQDLPDSVLEDVGVGIRFGGALSLSKGPVPRVDRRSASSSRPSSPPTQGRTSFATAVAPGCWQPLYNGPMTGDSEQRRSTLIQARRDTSLSSGEGNSLRSAHRGELTMSSGSTAGGSRASVNQRGG